MEDGDRLLLGLGLNLVERAVDDVLGDRLLAVIMIEFMNLVTIRSPNLGSGLTSRFLGFDLALFGDCPAGMELTLRYFGRLAPYFERRCLRSLTPCVSSTPRMMW